MTHLDPEHFIQEKADKGISNPISHSRKETHWSQNLGFLCYLLCVVWHFNSSTKRIPLDSKLIHILKRLFPQPIANVRGLDGFEVHETAQRDDSLREVIFTVPQNPDSKIRILLLLWRLSKDKFHYWLKLAVMSSLLSLTLQWFCVPNSCQYALVIYLGCTTSLQVKLFPMAKCLQHLRPLSLAHNMWGSTLRISLLCFSLLLHTHNLSVLL